MKIDKEMVGKFVKKVVIPGVGLGATIFMTWYDDKKLDDKIAKKIAESAGKSEN